MAAVHLPRGSYCDKTVKQHATQMEEIEWILVRVRVSGGGIRHSRSPDGRECGICGGVLVEMCTETPQSQQPIEIQNMLTEMLRV